MINIIKERLTKERIEPTPSERSVPSNDSIKKFYIEPNESTRVLDNKPFVYFVAETIKKTQKIEDKCTPKIFVIKHIKNSKKMHPRNTKKC